MRSIHSTDTVVLDAVVRLSEALIRSGEKHYVYHPDKTISDVYDALKVIIELERLP